MIPEKSDKGFGNRSLLEDLIKYVYNGIDCKLILIGDRAQLPPVHLDISPALNEETLNLNYNKQVICKELTKVVRQKKDSFILANATKIREKISNNDFTYPKFLTSKEVIELIQEKIYKSSRKCLWKRWNKLQLYLPI